MASNLEMRVLRLEAQVAAIQQQIAGILAAIAQLQQNQWRGLGGGGGGGSGAAVYFGCTLSSALAHLSVVTGQTVWKLEAGVRTTVSTNAIIYNDAPNPADDIAGGSQVILNANDDGTYTVVAVPC